MGKLQEPPRKTGSVKGVIEVISGEVARSHYVQVMTSVPGREGTFTKTWELEGNRLSENDARDLVAWVMREVDGILVHKVGIQGVLDL